MPWKARSLQAARVEFVQQLRRGPDSFSALCARFHISRQTGYKWRRRYRARGWEGLRERSRRPGRLARAKAPHWHARVRRLHGLHPRFGPKKLHGLLARRWGRRGLPAVRTLARWGRQWGWSAPRRPRRRQGPVRAWPGLRPPRQANDVWTVDFKGWFRTGKGTRVEPLTVRDLKSRYILAWELLPDPAAARARRVLRRLFLQHGLPRRIRTDNGRPFGGRPGAAGLTRLSVWWLRLGIAVEFIRPGRPGDNGAHERMHRDYVAECLQPAAATLPAQARRTRRFVRHYNHQRPHEALGQRLPAEGYRPSPRPCPRRLPDWSYPCSVAVRQVRPNGKLRWQGRWRFIGEAFAGERLGLRPLAPGSHSVWLGPHLLGELHAADLGGLRPLTHHYPA